MTKRLRSTPSQRDSQQRKRWSIPAFTCAGRGILALLLVNILCSVAVAAEPPPVHIAYFVTSDRQPIPGYVERLDRVMTEVQKFYQDGMEAAGYGPITFRLDRDDQGQLRVHRVAAQHPMSTYGRNGARLVRKEVKTALACKGLDMDQQTVVIFQTGLVWEGDKAVEVGPYCGSGNHLSGTAWVYDDERLDPRRLSSKTPGAYYHGPCSIGQFNSHYIGGVAHELGHAFGLPHVCQSQADRPRGAALMGAGNHTYGQEHRGQGPGTFLHPASAMRLANSRPFAGDRPDARQAPSCKLKTFTADYRQGQLLLAGQVAADPAPVGIIAYNDPATPAGDYDAVGWTSKTDDDGQFQLKIAEFRSGSNQLRLVVCHTSGATSKFSFDYQVDAQRKPDTAIFRYQLPLNEAIAAYLTGDRSRADTLAADLQRQFPNLDEVCRKATHLRRLLAPKPSPLAADRVADQDSLLLSAAAFRHASVGWGRPLRDQVLPERPGTCFLQVNGQFFESGLYAHAPASYEFDLARRWKRLRSSYGLQDGRDGSVVFVVRGDGQEFFRSTTIKDHQVHTLDLDISRVTRLELSTEDSGDGPRADWALWLQPRLER